MHRLLIAEIASPAAGADILWVPSTTDRISLVSFTAKLVTSSHVSNRVPDLCIANANGDVIWRQTPTAVQVASGTLVYCWSRSTNSPTTFTGSTTASLLLLDAWLPNGASVKTVTAGIDTADQWSSITASYHAYNTWEKDRWIEELARSIDLGG